MNFKDLNKRDQFRKQCNLCNSLLKYYQSVKEEQKIRLNMEEEKKIIRPYMAITTQMKKQETSKLPSITKD